MKEYETFCNLKSLKDAFECLKYKGSKVFIACTGAGAGIQNLLWQAPGISTVLMGATFPYHREEFDNFIGRNFSKSYCSLEAAVALAAASYFKCQEIVIKDGGDASLAMGIGLSAAVSTSRERKGEDKLFAVIRNNSGFFYTLMVMKKGYFERSQQGIICDLVVLNTILWASGLSQVSFAKNERLNLLSNQIGFEADGVIVSPKLLTYENFHQNDFVLAYTPDGEIYNLENIKTKKMIFPGSFNPLHFGHDNCAKIAKLFSGLEVIFEITANNVDKKSIAINELLKRAEQFRGRWSVVLTTGKSLFLEKSRNYGDCSFVVGADTLARIFDDKYYGGMQGLQIALLEMKRRGVHFYVFDRGGKFDMEIVPEEFRNMIVVLPGKWDISSTILRNKKED